MPNTIRHEKHAILNFLVSLAAEWLFREISLYGHPASQTSAQGYLWCAPSPDGRTFLGVSSELSGVAENFLRAHQVLLPLCGRQTIAHVMTVVSTAELVNVLKITSHHLVLLHTANKMTKNGQTILGNLLVNVTRMCNGLTCDKMDASNICECSWFTHDNMGNVEKQRVSGAFSPI